MKDIQKKAAKLHENVPPGWYFKSIRENPFQRYWHKKRFEEVSKLIKPVKGRVLDIGSCDGVFSKVILEKTKADKLIGIDVLENSVDWANSHWKKNKKMTFKVQDVHDLKFPDGYFDAVFALEVLEHVIDPEKALLEIKRVMKKGAYAVFLIPTENLLFKFIWFFWKLYRGRIWRGTHIHSYSNNVLVEKSKNAGFEIEKENKFLLNMLQVVRVIKVK